MSDFTASDAASIFIPKCIINYNLQESWRVKNFWSFIPFSVLCIWQRNHGPYYGNRIVLFFYFIFDLNSTKIIGQADCIECSAFSDKNINKRIFKVKSKNEAQPLMEILIEPLTRFSKVIFHTIFRWWLFNNFDRNRRSYENVKSTLWHWLAYTIKVEVKKFKIVMF